MPGECGKERNLPRAATARPGVRRACMMEPPTRYSCARGWHSADDLDDIGVAYEAHGAQVSDFEISFGPRVRSI